MIRDRRPEDLDRLTAILDELDADGAILAGRPPGDWLNEVAAERSWVFDQAPVRVAPTGNVVGHVQIYRPADVRWTRDAAAALGLAIHDVRTDDVRTDDVRTDDVRTDGLLVIGRLFVKPSRHDYGIARYLLTQSVSFVERQGASAVLDPLGAEFVPGRLRARLGFTEVPTGGGTVFVRTFGR